MSERNISINTYDKIDNIFTIIGKIFIPGSNSLIEFPGNQTLNLASYFFEDGSRLKLREENDKLVFRFYVCFAEGYNQKDLTYLVNEHENSFNVLAVRVQAACKKSKWCSSQKRLSLAELSKSNEFEIEIPLSEVKESISISHFLTREVESKNATAGKAQKAYSILSTGEDIKILVDPIKEVGGNHFPISPKSGLGDLLFKIDGLDKPVIIPQIYYTDELKDFFNRDDLVSVNSAFLLFSFYVLDVYLRWLVFISAYEDGDKDYKSFLELYSGYCEVTKSKLTEIVNLPKYSEEQTREYLSLSIKLFTGVQCGKAVNFKKEMKSLIKEEIKLKSYETIQNIN